MIRIISLILVGLTLTILSGCQTNVVAENTVSPDLIVLANHTSTTAIYCDLAQTIDRFAKAQEGDLIFARGKGGVVDAFIPGWFTHMGIIVVTPQGKKIIEAMKGDVRTVGYRTIDEWITARYTTICVQSLALEQAVKSQAVLHAQQMLGHRYFLLNKTNHWYHYCSQLVWLSYAHTGIDLDHDGGFAVPPDDIYWSPFVIKP